MKKSNERKKTCKKSETDNSDFSESYRLGSENSERVYTLGPNSSLANVKRELASMLDTMGPETPQFHTSSEADNDTSVMTGSSMMENPIKNDSDPPSLSQDYSDDQGTTTSSDTKNSSVLVEFPSSLDGRTDEMPDMYENPLCNVNTCYNNAPIQHSYMMNQYVSADPYIMGDSAYSGNMQPYYQNGNGFKKRKSLLEWFGFKPTLNPESDLYKVKIKQERPNGFPKQLTFERADRAPISIPPPFAARQPPLGTHLPRPLGGGEDGGGLAHHHGRPCHRRYEESCTMCEAWGPEPHAVRSLDYCRSCSAPACSDYSCPYLEGGGDDVDNAGTYTRPEMSRSAPAATQAHRQGSHGGSKLAGKSYTTGGGSPSKDDAATKDPGGYANVDEEKGGTKKDTRRKGGASKVTSHASKCEKVNCVCRSVKSVREFGRESTGFGSPVPDAQEEYRANDLVHVGLGGADQHNVTYYDSSGATRVDVYYFDHGNSGYYRTTDWAPHLSSEVIAQKTEAYTSRFWAEIFGTIHIGFSFCTSFVLQFIRFVLYSLMRPLVIGVLQLGSDYFFKPSLSTCFNSIIQPLLIFLYNIASSIRDLCDPIASGLGYYIREIAVFVRSLRIIEINQVKQSTPEQCIGHSKNTSPEEVKREEITR